MTKSIKPVKTVYISNLNYKIDEEDLVGIFGKFGKVHDVMIMMKPGGKLKKGMAFVRMASHASALKAVEALNGKTIDGRVAKAVLAKEDQKLRPKYRDNAEKTKPEDKKSTPRAHKSIKQKKTAFKDFLKSRK